VRGRKAVTIKGTYGSPEFAANYRAAREVDDGGRGAVGKHGTIEALARSYLRSAAFAGLATETQRSRRRLVEGFASKYGKLQVGGDNGLKRHNVKAIMDRLANKPGEARNTLSMLRVLMALAIEEGIRDDDPSAKIKRPKLSATGWHTWDEDEIAAFETRHPVGTMPRLAFALALHTGQRAADLRKMGKQHISDGMIAVVQQKTATPLWIPIHPQLGEIIAKTPINNLTLIVSETGQPYSSAGTFSHAMNRWAKQAGITGAPLHGLRKACCRRLAELGCTIPQIMAISGHKSLAEVERYIKAASQKLLAKEAIARTLPYPRADKSYPRRKKS
jgi:integrase